MLGHEPLASALDDIGGFYASARERGGHGFEYSRRLASAMRAAGLTAIHEGTLDEELAFDGPAPSDVIARVAFEPHPQNGLRVSQFT